MTVSAEALTSQIEAVLNSIAADRSWREPQSFARRAELAERLEVHVVDRVAAAPAGGAELARLARRAQRLSAELTDCDERFFSRLRERIRGGGLRGHALRDELMRHAPARQSRGYDCLDALVDSVFRPDAEPHDELLAREPEMVFYQPTPVRVTLELTAALELGPHDVFCDLGAGLGQVCMLVHLLTGARTRAVEFQPAYCDYARQCAERLALRQIEIVNGDAREVSTEGVTVFYMYTPFRGAMMDAVLARLQRAASARRLRVCAYGDCTEQVARQRWLRRRPAGRDGQDQAAIFEVLAGS